jgi:UDP-glucose 4-epimerase
MKKILVTGGTGFIGSHTVVELLESGFDVTVIDNLSNSSISVLEGINKIAQRPPLFQKVDMTDAKALNSFFHEHHDFDGIIHFAAFKAVGESVSYPLKYYSNNLVSMVNLLENLVAHNMRNLVFSSSCTVYGKPDTLPVTEKSPVKKALSPYGNTKIISEQIIEDLIKTIDFNAISLRYFNPIGAHPSALIGELPIGIPNNLIPYITQTAIGKRNKVVVYGNDYETPDGTCIRDYIHVTDLARAHVIAVKRLLDHKQLSGYEIFNIGTGKGYSVLEIINTFEKVSGIKLNVEMGPRRQGDIAEIYADTTIANRELGWNAKESLESMISSAWKWEQEINRK